jgi:hypothetical protein
LSFTSILLRFFSPLKHNGMYRLFFCAVLEHVSSVSLQSLCSWLLKETVKGTVYYVFTRNIQNSGAMLSLGKVAVGQDSSVGIETGYGLDGPGIESRWGARFSAPVQTGPGAHPASCTMSTGSFPGAKRPGCGVDHLPHLAPRLK